VEAYLDLGATPADFFTADPTPVPSEAAEPEATAPSTVASPPSGSDASEISADSLEILPPALDEKGPEEVPVPAMTAEPEGVGAVAPAVTAETADSQSLDAGEVEPEAVMMVADSSEQTFELSGRQTKTPTTPTPPPVPPEAALPTPARSGAPDTAKHPAPEPSPPPQILAATLFDEYQRPASAEDDVPEALARRPLQKRSKPWYEEVFDDDYLRTVPFMTPDQTAREVDFIRDALALKPNSEVLDVACGYGRHAVELAQQGIRVTGLDLSLPLLIKAADHAQKRGLAVNFVHADVREMTFNSQFDAAYCVLSSFGYFDEETNLKVATGICRALKPGGRFLLDIINRDYLVGDLPSRVWWEGDGCVILEEVDFNYHTSRVLVRRSVVFGNGRQSEQEISMRAYSLHEVGRLLRMAGLRVLDVSGSLATKSRFFGAASRNIIALCERPAP
jgi:SAM-dependent methyltransferase